jgi:hypothetical protein
MTTSIRSFAVALVLATVSVTGCAMDARDADGQDLSAESLNVGRGAQVTTFRYEGTASVLGQPYTLRLAVRVPTVIEGGQTIHCSAFRSNEGTCRWSPVGGAATATAELSAEIVDSDGTVLARKVEAQPVIRSRYVPVIQGGSPVSSLGLELAHPGVIAELGGGRKLIAAQSVYGLSARIPVAGTVDFTAVEGSQRTRRTIANETRLSTLSVDGSFSFVSPTSITVTAGVTRDARDGRGEPVEFVLARID